MKAGEHDAWYVAQKDVAKNVLYVVQGHDHPAPSRTACSPPSCRGCRAATRAPTGYTAKPRYRTPDAPCEIDALADGRAEILRAAPVGGDAGQSVVIYESKGVPRGRHHRLRPAGTRQRGAAAPLFLKL